ncbi:hypothetical protein, partial [Micromonospora aurantiaca (nom. illeg.)]|uniref:hypothetical protein n=1 Tax=Micromonospora aurantiaca (nom. illeg.) TaxID=47850 RepID=UPI0037FAF5CE
WFGERWITSIFDLFEENVRYFPPLLPICEEEDPAPRRSARLRLQPIPRRRPAGRRCCRLRSPRPTAATC